MTDLNDKLAGQIRSQKKTFASIKSDETTFMVCDRRVLAFLIDIAALLAIGRVIVIIAGDNLAFMGEDGWWLGLGVAALYFALLDGPLGGGRTLGKRIVSIEVQHISGQELSFIDALLRFVPFGLLFAIEFATRFTDPTSFIIHGLRMFEIFIALSIIVFGLLHPQHRALQDLLLDSVVIRSKHEFQLPRASVRKSVFALILAYLLFGGIYLIETSDMFVSRDGQLASRMWRIVNARENSQHPYVFMGSTTSLMGLPNKTVFVHIFLPLREKMSDKGYLASSARIINAELMQKTPMPDDVDMVMVFIRSGYDIGIWREYQNADFSFLTAQLDNLAPSIRLRTTRGQSQVDR